MFSMLDVVKARTSLAVTLTTGLTALIEQWRGILNQTEAQLDNPQAAAEFLETKFPIMVPAMQSMIRNPLALLHTFDRICDDLQSKRTALHAFDTGIAAGNFANSGTNLLEKLSGDALLIVNKFRQLGAVVSESGARVGELKFSI